MNSTTLLSSREILARRVAKNAKEKNIYKDLGFRAAIIVEQKVIIEIKSFEAITYKFFAFLASLRDFVNNFRFLV